MDYSLLPSAPADVVTSGKSMAINIKAGEVVAMTFDGAGGGTWVHSDTSSGNLSGVSWTDSAPSAGVFGAAVPQAKFIPLGQLEVTFDSPVGSENWQSVDVRLSYHTETSGWVDGVVNVTGPGGLGTASEMLRVPFTYTP